MVADSSKQGITRQQLSVWIAKVQPAWLLLLLPLLLLIPTLTSFPYPAQDAPYSDITITHFPNAIFLKDTIASWGSIPFWSPTIMSGYPFASNPLSGMWYPPGWLALILPLPLGFNLLIGLHLVWGGIGLYQLMRSEGLTRTGALVAGVSFGLLPKLFAHYGAGHLTLLYAVPWTPWLLLFQRSNPNYSKQLKVPPGLILALIFLADVRWGAFAMLTWWGYAVVHQQDGYWNTFKRLALQSALALLLAAPQLVPLIELSALSTRAGMSAAEVLEWSIPFFNLLGLIFPNPGTNHEWVLYLGSMLIMLALGGLLLSSSRRRKSFWGILTLVAIFAAAGSHLPGAEWIASVPLVSLLRVPTRALFLAGLGFTSLAGYGLDALAKKPSPKRVKVYTLSLFGLGVFAVLLLAGAGFVSGEITNGMIWGTLGVIISTTWIISGLNGRLPLTLWFGGIFMLMLLDLMFFNLSSFVGKAADQVLAERAEVAEYISRQDDETRTYSPSYSLPQHTAALYGIHMADGVDPLQIAAYAQFMDHASGVPRDGYSVTIPPYASGEPGTDNEAYQPDAIMLGQLNVGYVISEFDLLVDGLILDRIVDGARIYKNEYARSPAWLQPGDVDKNVEIIPTENLTRKPNQLSISAAGPGKLVISEVAYPGWKVRIDGVEHELLVSEEILMGVELTSGMHQVDFLFRPVSVYIGLFLFCTGLTFLGWNLKRDKQLNSKPE